jgi:hypothetical protein
LQRKPKMAATRRVCIFCDDPVTSKEHIWSRWMHPLLDGNKSGYNRQTITRWRDGKEEIAGPVGKPGNVSDIQVRAVCKTCNNGWMNRQEQLVRPFFEPMIKGEKIVLEPEQLGALAVWCAIKFIVMEHSAIETALTPRDERLKLREEGKIPEYFRIYIGNHNSKSFSASVRHSHTMALSAVGPKPELNGTDRNIQTITLLMGRLFIHLNAARVDGFEIEQAYWISRVWDECRIWPDANCSLAWPHRPLVSDNGLGLIGNTLDTLLTSGKATWMDGFPVSAPKA